MKAIRKTNFFLILNNLIKYGHDIQQPLGLVIAALFYLHTNDIKVFR